MKVSFTIFKNGKIVFHRASINLEEIDTYKDNISIYVNHDQDIKYDITLNTKEVDSFRILIENEEEE